MSSSPAAPGSLGVAPSTAEVLTYLGRLDAWLRERRAELDGLDGQIASAGRQAELIPDLTLALALWQAAKTRQNLLLTTWDSGRVGREELERISALIWGRLDTESSEVSQLQSMSVSLPEAGRLNDALVAQLRSRLNTDPRNEQRQLRLRDLRAQLERIRDQVKLEPPTLAQTAQAKLAALAGRTDELAEKHSRGGDIDGLLSSLEVDAARLERDLIVGAAQRRESRDLVAKARDDLERTIRLERDVRNLATQVSELVWPAPKVGLPAVSTLGPLPNTRTALIGYVDSLTQAGAQLTEARTTLHRAFAERDACAALLEALEAKATALGHGNDPQLAAISALVAEHLSGRPVAVPVVQQLLAAYSAQLDYLAKR